VKLPSFRTRLFLILSLFAVVPALAVTVAWGVALRKAVPLVSGAGAWQRVAASGSRVHDVLRNAPLSPAQRAALRAHEDELALSAEQSQRFSFLARRSVPVIMFSALAILLLLGVLASRVAGHLSRQMSRPLNELVGWAELIERQEPLPAETRVRGAPEFRVLRERMRTMSAALASGRTKAVETERLRAFRESARRVAHELKNPLTPIRFALARLKHAAPADLSDVVEVLDVETSRRDGSARAFGQLGRLADGPASDVDVGEWARYTARATIPANIAASVTVEDQLPMIRGDHDALQRALANVLHNAVDACGVQGTIAVRVGRERVNGSDGVAIAVRDSGRGIAPEQLQRIWEPYVTNKPGGTGLGLAIAHQTILAHHGSVSATSDPASGTEIRFVLPSTGVAADT
jgi:signal transduction histidine kinase